MKKIIIILLFIAPLQIDFIAQNQIKKPNRIAFLSENMNLSSEEAEKFWPLLNDLENELKSLKKEIKEAKPDKKVNEMSDKQIEELLDASFIHKQRELDIKTKYHEEFKKILPIKKIAKFYHLEQKFKKMKKQSKQHPGSKPGKNAPY
tara:strand:+ start:27 stop:470 length:444 start_codon:yes stop_codon:yes gene_type:complete